LRATFLLFGVSGLAFSTWVTRLPAVRTDLDLTTPAVGVLLAAVALGAVAGLAAAGTILRRVGLRAGVVGACVVLGTSLAAAGLAVGPGRGFLATGLALTVFGFGYGVLDVLMNLSGAEVERAANRALLPLLHAVFTGGTIAGAALSVGATWIGVSPTVQLAAVGGATSSAAVLASRWPLPRRTFGEGRQVPGGDSSSSGRATGLLALGVMVTGLAFAEGAGNDWLSLAAVDGHGAGQTAGAAVYGSFVLATLLGRAGAGFLLDRLGARRVLPVAIGIAAAGSLLFVLAEAAWLVFLAAGLWGIGGSLGFPVAMSIAGAHPTDGPRRVQLVAALGYGAFLAGPPVIGFLGHLWGLLEALVIVSALLTVSLVASGFLGSAGEVRSGRERESDASGRSTRSIA